jgi:hypothetical protein
VVSRPPPVRTTARHGNKPMGGNMLFWTIILVIFGVVCLAAWRQDRRHQRNGNAHGSAQEKFPPIIPNGP